MVILLFLLSHDIRKLKSDLSFSLQNNFSVSVKLLKELHREAKTNHSWLLQWVHSFSRYSHKRSHSQRPLEQLSNMLKTIRLLGEQGGTFLCYLMFHTAESNIHATITIKQGMLID